MLHVPCHVLRRTAYRIPQACREVAKDYPNIDYQEIIVDNTCMQLVAK